MLVMVHISTRNTGSSRSTQHSKQQMVEWLCGVQQMNTDRTTITLPSDNTLLALTLTSDLIT